MHEVPSLPGAEVSANGSRKCFSRVRLTHYDPRQLDSIHALTDETYYRAAHEEVVEVLEIRLGSVLGIVQQHLLLTRKHHLHRGNLKTLALQTPDTLADEIPLDSVGLERHETSLSYGYRYVGSSGEVELREINECKKPSQLEHRG